MIGLSRAISLYFSITEPADMSFVTCSKGHQVSLGARFCQQCSEPLPRVEAQIAANASENGIELPPGTRLRDRYVKWGALVSLMLLSHSVIKFMYGAKRVESVTPSSKSSLEHLTLVTSNYTQS